MTNAVYIHPAEARRRFRELAERPIRRDDLARAALLIALEESPRLDIDSYLGRLDGLADRTRAKINPGEPPIFLLGHLHAVLFDEEGFSGSVEDYYDPRNAFLNEVMDRRRGLPISLSVIFLHVAHRIGLDSVGVGLPGHYIVKVRFDLNEVYVDPFEGGQTLDIGEIGQLVSVMSGGQVTLRSEHLRAWSERETLIRILANLQSFHARRGDTFRAAAARERIGLLAEAAPGRRQ